MSGWSTLYGMQSGRRWKSGGNRASGANPSMQAALDEMREMQYEYPRLTFKVVQNADLTYQVQILADNGQDGKSFAGTVIAGMTPYNGYTEVGQASPKPSGEAVGDQLDAQGAEWQLIAPVGGPVDAIRESYITQFTDPTTFVG